MSAFLPKNFSFWPEDAGVLEPEQVVELYGKGFAGAFQDVEARDEFNAFISSQPFGSIDGETLAHANGFADSGAGQLVIPFVFIEKYYPGSLPGPAQQRGDCVSHGNKNAVLTTMACDIASGKPDEVTGVVEGPPTVSETGIKNGVLSTEIYYWFRGYDSDGWSCEAAANVTLKKAGLWLRQPYDELGFSLEKYSGSLAGKYGSRKPPEAIVTAGKDRLVRTATRLNSFEAIRDYLMNGYGVSSCGGEGFSNKRDENGVSQRSGSWAHAMAIIGADEREEIIRIYKEPLVLILNSWAIWNSGPRRILGTNIDIPNGAFWARWSQVRNRSYTAFSGVPGWPAKRLPPFSFVVG